MCYRCHLKKSKWKRNWFYSQRFSLSSNLYNRYRPTKLQINWTIFNDLLLLYFAGFNLKKATVSACRSQVELVNLNWLSQSLNFIIIILKVQSKVNHKLVFRFGDVIPKHSETCYRCHLKNEKHIESDSVKKLLFSSL